MTSFKLIKSQIIASLRAGSYQHEARKDISIKNLLQSGDVSAAYVEELLKNCTNDHLTTSRHHQDSNIDVHIILKSGWYVKFYFIDPETIFISVHQERLV